MSIDCNTYSYKQMMPEDYFRFDCSECGDCCRNVNGAVRVESLDLYRLARFTGLEMSEACLQFTDTALLVPGFPILVLKTKQHMDACVFLKSSRCSVHSAKPRACRTYPLGVVPDDEKPGVWLNFIVSKTPHHFTGRHRRVGDWLDENLTAEDREFVAADCANTEGIAKRMRDIDPRHDNRVAELLLFFKYIAYDMTEDFMPQYTRNMELLKEQLGRLIGAGA